VYCGTLLSKGGKLFFLIETPYDTTIILEHFLHSGNMFELDIILRSEQE
jgi:hypothetical protein